MDNLSKQSSGTVLYIGFSYSMEKDSAPGSYNRMIARSIERSLPADNQHKIWIGAQWEIYDALDESTKQQIPDSHVVPPPLFQKQDIGNLNQLVKAICSTGGEKSPRGDVLTILRQHIKDTLQMLIPADPQAIDAAEEIRSKIVYPDQMSAILNCLSVNDKFLRAVLNVKGAAEHFATLMELRRPRGPQNQRTFTEARGLPNTNGGPAPLSCKYQTRRLTRLIVESLLKEYGLREGVYLNTMAVTDRLLDRANTEGIELDQVQRVKIFGFPEHSPRCVRTVVEALWMHGVHAIVVRGKKEGGEGAVEVLDVNNPSGRTSFMKAGAAWYYDGEWQQGDGDGEETLLWQWDESTAQEWCRSLENWLVYERLGPGKA